MCNPNTITSETYNLSCTYSIVTSVTMEKKRVTELPQIGLNTRTKRAILNSKILQTVSIPGLLHGLPAKILCSTIFFETEEPLTPMLLLKKPSMKFNLPSSKEEPYTLCALSMN